MTTLRQRGQRKLAFIGGTGLEGRGLALRFALAGEMVIIGSRQAERALKTARRIEAVLPSAQVAGMENSIAVQEGDILFITVPYAAMQETLSPMTERVLGKIVVSTVVPVRFEGRRPRAMEVAEGSAAQEAQALLPGGLVVAAFHTLSAKDLADLDSPLDSDVVVCSDSTAAKRLIMELAEEIEGVRAVDGGELDNAHYLEALTALLLNINRFYNSRSSVRITGLERGKRYPETLEIFEK